MTSPPAENDADVLFSEETLPDDALWIDIEPGDVASIVAQLLEHVCGLGVSDLFLCTDEHVLGHLRGPGAHVRGCWVVDLVLKKK